eukprot:snap_masked-scaffold_4-processed-gene-11.27-mRNA-1 protein AED:0.35 eAED:0.35 QI:0/-1/0/1/-1/1/1/0/350
MSTALNPSISVRLNLLRGLNTPNTGINQNSTPRNISQSTQNTETLSSTENNTNSSSGNPNTSPENPPNQENRRFFFRFPSNTSTELRQEISLSLFTALPAIFLTIGYFSTDRFNDVNATTTNCDSKEVDDTQERLQLWLIVNILRILFLNSTLFYYWIKELDISPLTPEGRSIANLQSLSFLWIFIGIWFLLTASCTEIPVYTFCLSIILIECFILFLPCVVLILLLPLVFFCLPCVIRAFVALNGNDRGASKKFINSLPLKKFKEIEKPEKETTCPICLVNFEEEDEVRVLPCNGNHYFHKTCVDDWLVLNATCPLCRDVINKEAVNAEPLSEQDTAQPTVSGTTLQVV